MKSSLFVVLVAAIVAGSIAGLDSTSGQSPPTFMTVKRVPPPIIWEADLPEGEMQVGEVMTATVSLYFYEMPAHQGADPVWQARFLFIGPDGKRKISSELQQIVIGQRESFQVTRTIELGGTYKIRAWIVAVTAPAHGPATGERGNVFRYRSGHKNSSVVVPNGVEPDTGWHQVKGTTAKIKRVELTDPKILGQIGGKATLKRKDNVPLSPSQKQEENELRYYRFRIPPYSTEPLKSIVLKDIRTKVGAIHILEFDGIEQIDSVRLTYDSLGELIILNNNSLRLDAAKTRVKSRLDVFFGDRVARIFFNKAKQTFNISGVFQFENNLGNMLSVAQMHASIYILDDFGYWILLDEGWTDATGFVSLMSDDDESFFVLSAKSTNTSIWFCEDHDCLDVEWAYLHSYTIKITNPGHQDVDIDPPFSEIRRPSMTGAFNIARELIIAEDNLTNEVNPWPLPDLVPVLWDSACSDDISPSYSGFTVGGEPAIFLRGEESPDSNSDEWDAPVLLHEYSHHIMAEYAIIDPYAGGTHDYIAPAYVGNQDQWRSNLLAYSEGWANFFQGVLRGESDLSDININGDSVISYEFERPDPDVPYTLLHDQGSDPSNTTPFFHGGMVEGAVTEAFWDIYDLVDDGDFYIGGDLVGHNNDFNGNEYWAGIDYIWDVFWDFDPQPDNPDVEYCRTIYDFIHGWRVKGYPVSGKFYDIFTAHNVAVFLPGDADGSGILDITDAVYMLSYVMVPGSPPPVPVRAAGDADGNCILEITDVSYLVSYVFVPGSPAPVPGCA